jgi:phosphopantothenoylcysteine decarboxylase/phosphopantothenate--cysteine ligase
MYAAVTERAQSVDAVIMAAAVADYAPVAGPASRKIEKGQPLTLTLERTPDILAELGRRRGGPGRPVLVGFSASTGDPAGPARQKLDAKQVDLIVGNDVSQTDAGFDVETNRVVLVTRDGLEPLPLLRKSDVAKVILDRVTALLTAPTGEPVAR